MGRRRRLASKRFSGNRCVPMPGSPRRGLAANEGPTTALVQNIYEGLTERDRTGRLGPLLAVSWRMLPEDPTIWEFKLRQGVVFQDGSRFSADDVVFSYRRALQPNSGFRDHLASVADIEKVDDTTVRFRTRRPKPVFIANTPAILIMSKAWAERHGTAAIPDSPIPDAIEVPDSAAGQIVWLMMPIAAPNTREVDEDRTDSASRYVRTSETFIDSTSALRIEEEIDIAYPRLSFELRKTSKPGYMGLGIARILEVRDKNILFDDKFVPPMLVCAAHPVIDGWLNRIIGWVETKLDELARYAVDPSSGGGLQSVDYLVLQVLNRTIPILTHFQRSGSVHPERLYEELLRFAGELATFATAERRARNYPAYDHDDLENVFTPLVSDCSTEREPT